MEARSGELTSRRPTHGGWCLSISNTANKYASIGISASLFLISLSGWGWAPHTQMVVVGRGMFWQEEASEEGVGSSMMLLGGHPKETWEEVVLLSDCLA